MCAPAAWRSQIHRLPRHFTARVSLKSRLDRRNVDRSFAGTYYRSEMIILSADTSTAYYSVGLSDDEHVLGEVTVEGGRKHSERLLETVDWLLRECGFELGDVEMLAVSHGPGSFTGLRIGVSAWKGLALGADLPLVGVSTLDAMARLSPALEGVLCPLLDAKMQEVYGALYRFENGQRLKLNTESVGPVEDILAGLSGPVMCLGEGAEEYRDRIAQVLPEAAFAPEGCNFPRASAVACEAMYALAEGASCDAAQLRPVYLRKSQAEQARAEALRGATSQ